MGDQTKIKIGASLGLVAIAVIHATLLAIALQAPSVVREFNATTNPVWQGPAGLTSSDLQSNTGTNFDDLPAVKSSAVRSVAPINVTARDEIKHGIFGRRFIVEQPQQCVNCPQPVNRYPVYPTVTQPQYRQPTIYPTIQPQPANYPTPQPVPQPYPVPPTPLKPAPTPNVGVGKCELALFVDGGQQSQQLQQWFANDQNLAKLKAKCAYQIYTADNALYQSRFAKTVPRELFPALLFLRPDGGHIHAAGGVNLPASPAALYADLQASYRLMQQMEQAPQPSPIVDPSVVNPMLNAVVNFAQASDNCPDGNCTPERDGIFPILRRDKDGGTVQGLLRDLANTGSETTVAAIALIVLMFLGFVVINSRNRTPPMPPAAPSEPWLV
jgi:hypothetical protein